MRVIAGKYKGRRLAAPKGASLRPTTDKVKEAMFGALHFDVKDAAVLDAFAGTGALGIEALSRGAAHVYFIEKNPACLRVLKANLSALGADNYTVVRGDAIAKMAGLGRFDILLLDPPYDAGIYLPALLAARSTDILNPGAKVVMESRAAFDFELPAGYNLIKRRDYGDISLWFLETGD